MNAYVSMISVLLILIDEKKNIFRQTFILEFRLVIFGK
jgi:hypothetical protein